MKKLRGAPPIRASSRLLRNPYLPSTAHEEPITSRSVIVQTAHSQEHQREIINCTIKLSDPSSVKSKATWLATMNGTRVVLKYWPLKHGDL